VVVFVVRDASAAAAATITATVHGLLVLVQVLS
jgi:hypothetical protein